MNKLKTKFLNNFAALVGSFIAFTPAALAQNPGDPDFMGPAPGAASATDYFDPAGTVGSQAGLPQTSVLGVTLNIISGFLSVLGIITLVLIIYGGFTIMTSGGNQEKTKKGKDVLFWAIIGAIIILSSLGIVNFIDSAI